jgi:hypothetical protein
MAFPGNFNIDYYRGDTYEFKIYPKDNSGAAFPLTGYNLTEGVKFTISTERGMNGIEDQIEAFAEISADLTHITCAILPSNGADMTSNLPYEYDIEISKDGSQYPLVTTLLSGQIRVREQVSGAV